MSVVRTLQFVCPTQRKWCEGWWCPLWWGGGGFLVSSALSIVMNQVMGGELQLRDPAVSGHHEKRKAAREGKLSGNLAGNTNDVRLQWSLRRRERGDGLIQKTRHKAGDPTAQLQGSSTEWVNIHLAGLLCPSCWETLSLSLGNNPVKLGGGTVERTSWSPGFPHLPTPAFHF